MQVQTIALAGHLTREALAHALEPVTIAAASATEPIGLVVDARAMSGYDKEARELFVAWNSEHRPRIARIAILTDNKLWYIVIAAMALASGQRMKAFSTFDEASEWLDAAGVPGPSRTRAR